MLEKIITEVLNSALGDFIEDIHPEQLDISITQGKVRLENMAIKASAFDAMPVPFQLAFGKVGLIQLDIPVFSLTSSPLVVNVSDVLIALTPRKMNEWKEEVEIEAFKASTQASIDRFEAIQSKAAEMSQQDPGTFARMVQNILANMQINISNIFIKLEDDVTTQSRGAFTLGVSLKSLAIGPEKNLKDDDSKILRKNVKIDALSIYLDQEKAIKLSNYDCLYDNDPDSKQFAEIIEKESQDQEHSFLLEKFELEVKIAANSDPLTNLKPQAEADLILGGSHSDGKQFGIIFSLCQPQVARLLKLTEYSGFYNEFREGLLKQYKERSMNLEQSSEYVKLYCQYKNAKDDEKEELRKQLKQIEEQFSYQKVVPLRTFAMKILMKEESEAKELEQMRAKALELEGEKLGYTGRYFYSQETIDKAQKEVEEFQKQMRKTIEAKYDKQDDQLQEEFEKINSELQGTLELMPPEEEMGKLSSDYIRYTTKIRIPKMILKIENEYAQKVISGEMHDLRIDVKLGNEFYKAKMSIDNIFIMDKWSGSSQFQYLLDTRTTNKNDQVQTEQAFKFQVDFNPENEIAPMKVHFTTGKTIFFVANFQTAKELSRTMNKAIYGEKFDFTFFTDLVGFKAVKYREAGKQLMEQLQAGEYEHQAFDLTMHLTPPVLIVPQDIFDKRAPCGIFDMGQVIMTNKLQKPQKNPKSLTEPNLLYDNYIMQVKDVELKILYDGFEGEMQNYSEEKKFYSIIDDVCISGNIFKSHEINHPLFPSIEATLSLENFSMKIHSDMIKCALNMKETLMDSLNFNESILLSSNQSEEQEKLAKEKEYEKNQNFMNKLRNSLLLKLDQTHSNDETKVMNSIEESVNMKLLDRLEQIKQVQLPTYNYFLSIEKVTLSFAEIIPNESKPKDFLIANLNHFGVAYKIAKDQSVSMTAEIRQMFIYNASPIAETTQIFRFVLANPENIQKLSLGSVFSSEKPKMEESEKFGLENFKLSCLRHSLLALKHFELKEDHNSWLQNNPPSNEFFYHYIQQSDGFKTTTEGYLKHQRFTLALTTLQRMQNFSNEFNQAFYSVQDKAQILNENRIKQMKALANGKLEEESEKDRLISKVFANLAKDSEIPYKKLLTQTADLQRFLTTKPLLSQELSDEERVSNLFKEALASKFSETKKTLSPDRIQTKTEKISSETSFKLESVSIWVPLTPETEESELLALGLKAEISMQSEQEFKINFDKFTHVEIERKEVENTSNQSFGIENFSIVNFESVDHAQIDFVTDLQKSQNSEKPASCMLEPVKLLMMQDQSLKDEHLDTKVLLHLEPMIFKVGFTQIDFFARLSEKSARLPQTQAVQRVKEVSLDEQELGQNQVQNKDSQSQVSLPEQPFKTSSYKVEAECEEFGAEVLDDSIYFAKKSLLLAKIKNLTMKYVQSELNESSAEFIIKKTLPLKYLKRLDQTAYKMFMDVEGSMLLDLTYFNHSTYQYEPFIEPWGLNLSVGQASKFSQLCARINSDSTLSINITHALSQAIAGVEKRISSAVDTARKLESGYVEKEQDLTSSFTKRSLSQSQTLAKQTTCAQDKEDIEGYIVRNSTGVTIDLFVDQFKKEEADDQEEQNDDQTQENKFQIVQKVIEIDSNKKDQFYSLETLKQIQKRTVKDLDSKNIGSHAFYADIQIEGFKKIKNVTFDCLGVHAFKTDFIENYEGEDSHLFAALSSQNKKLLKQNGLSLICNLKIEGNHKILSFESSLVLFNNFPTVMTLAVSPSTIDSNENIEDLEIHRVQDHTAFKAPLLWFIQNQSIYLKTSNQNYVLIQKNILENLTPNFSLDQSQQNICALNEENFLAVNTMAFKCKPKSWKTPDQYLLSFCEPLVVSNKTFSPLSCAYKGEAILVLKPKESASVRCLGGKTNKYNLDWSLMVQKDQILTCNEKDFQIMPSAELQQKKKKFIKDEVSKTIKFVAAPISTKRADGYDDDFDSRDEAGSLISSIELTAFSKYMLVNKTGISIIAGDKQLAHIIDPFSEKYYSGKSHSYFKVKGYDWSKQIDLKAVGYVGCLELNKLATKQKAEIILSQLSYNPEKLQFGIKVENCSAPYHRTTMITIVPRYVLVNQLQIPIAIKQHGLENQIFKKPIDYSIYEKEELEQRQLIDGNLSYYLEKPIKNQFIQIREASEEEEVNQSQKVEKTQWSTPFSILNKEQFQISIPNLKPEDQDSAGLEELIWHLPSNKNKQKRFVRVLVTTNDEATLNIIFSEPLIPEYKIENKSDFQVQFSQEQEKTPCICQPKQASPFAWSDRTVKNRRLKLKIQSEDFSAEEIIGIDQVTSKESNRVVNSRYTITIDIQGNQKVVAIENSKSFLIQAMVTRMIQREIYFEKLFSSHFNSKMNVSVLIQGVSVSLIDSEPKEFALLTLREISFNQRNWQEHDELITHTSADLGHMQIDNMLETDQPVIFAPTKKYQKCLEEDQEEENKGFNHRKSFVPFIQFQTIQSQTKNSNNTRIKLFDFNMQELAITIESSDVEVGLKFKYLLEKPMSLSSIELDLSNRHKELSQSIEQSMKEIFEDRDDVCKDLIATTPQITKQKSLPYPRIYVDKLHISPISFIISFKFEKQEKKMKNEQDIIDLGIVGTLFSGVISISRTPIKFKELNLSCLFMRQEVLTQQIQQNYTNQAKSQVFTILGSSDMIGNPVALLDKLNSGLLDLATEPLIGLNQGPIEFFQGFGHGMASLQNKAVSGGMNSVSKVTGSLYGVLKNATGETPDLEHYENIGSGFVEGFKGFGEEIYDGVVNVVKKPVQGSREEGVIGGIKGFGQGIFCLVASPFTATLKLSSAITGGIAESTNDEKYIFGNNQCFRQPRYINANEGLQTYCAKMADAQMALKTICDGRFDSNIIANYFPIYKPNIDKNNHLIETDKYLVYCGHKFQKLFFITELTDIIKVKMEENEERQRILTIKAQKSKIAEEFTNSNLVQVLKLANQDQANQIFESLKLLPSCEAKTSVEQEK